MDVVFIIYFNLACFSHLEISAVNSELFKDRLSISHKVRFKLLAFQKVEVILLVGKLAVESASSL
jgi:hypothetical protein